MSTKQTVTTNFKNLGEPRSVHKYMSTSTYVDVIKQKTQGLGIMMPKHPEEVVPTIKSTQKMEDVYYHTDSSPPSPKHRCRAKKDTNKNTSIRNKKATPYQDSVDEYQEYQEYYDGLSENDLYYNLSLIEAEYYAACRDFDSDSHNSDIDPYNSDIDSYNSDIDLV